MPRRLLRRRRSRLAAVNPALLIVLGVLALVAVVFFAWQNMGGSNAIAEEQMTFYCTFDDGEVTIAAQDLLKTRNAGDAVLGRGAGPPTRLRCPVCDRPSCFMKNSVTGEEIVVDPEWDLETWPENTTRGGGVQQQ